MTLGRLLPELPEAAAGGTAAAAYENIRRTLELPFVPLVYRHLATRSGRLEAIWAAIRPNLVDRWMDTTAAELAAVSHDAVAPISPRSLAAVCGSAELRVARATLAAYGHANPRNLLCVVTLLEPAGMAGERARPSLAPPPRAAPGLLPMADLSALEPSVVALLLEMSRAVGKGGDDVIVPSLFRHLAHNADLLALLWDTVRPPLEAGEIAERARLVVERAGTLAPHAPHPVRVRLAPGEREALSRFRDTIPRLVVLGAMMQEALPKS